MFTLDEWAALNTEYKTLKEDLSGPSPRASAIIDTIQKGLRPISDEMLVHMVIDALMLVYDRDPDTALHALSMLNKALIRDVLGSALNGAMTAFTDGTPGEPLACGHTPEEHQAMVDKAAGSPFN